MSELKEIEPVETEDIEKQTEEVKPRRKAKKAWVIDSFKATKACPDCGKELHGWAFRQDFRFCPFCGVELTAWK